MKKLYLYTIFHLNLAYSSIPEKDYPVVIERCYKPLFNICDKMNICLGIEVSGYTLEKIKEISPSLILKWKKMLRNKKCELIGSGYAQIIGPLVPAEVNSYNLKIGNKIYQSILGVKPKIAFASEQAYSQGLIENYLNTGYKTIIMEWNNPYRYHPEWNREWQYYPQTVLNQNGGRITLIWNNSIAFQKFQRYAQGEIELEEYADYLKTHLGKSIRFFPLYGNDAEIFDYRPGRYDTEAEINQEGELNRINELFKKLSVDFAFNIITPSKILKLAQGKNAFNQIYLESPEQPIPVKKQEKYNITRWALTGRDDLINNTKCYKIYNVFKKAKEDDIHLWKKLCFLWSSDFRTHIEEKKYLSFQKRLNSLLLLTKNFSKRKSELEKIKIKKNKEQFYQPVIIKNDKIVTVETEFLKVVLNRRRGLAINSLIFKNISNQPLICTLPHGYYEDISLGADFYSGHTIVEIPGKTKLTDLNPVNPIISKFSNSGKITIKAILNINNLGKIYKNIVIFTKENRIDLNYEFELSNLPSCSFYSGIITLNPKVFDLNSLYYSCCNGGREKEKFFLKGKKTIHNEPVSFLISSKNVLGNTEESLKISDQKKSVIFKTDMAKLAILPMINFIQLSSNFFLRILFSLSEIDDTRLVNAKKRKFGFNISITT